jgi:transcription elongation factor GreA
LSSLLKIFLPMMGRNVLSTDEARPREGLISFESPLGQALLDRHEGDEILVNAPAGT